MRLARLWLAAALLLAPTSGSLAVDSLLIPETTSRCLDDNGDPVSGCQIAVKAAGTDNDLVIYSDAGLTVAASNPIVSDSSGEFPDAYIGTADYKVVLKDFENTPIKTRDGRPGALDTTPFLTDVARPQQPILSTATNLSPGTADLGSIVNASASSGNVTITLPSAVLAGDGGQLAVRKSDDSVNTVTIATDGSQLIDGASTYVLSKQYESVTIVSDGANWHTIDDVAPGSIVFNDLASTAYSTDGTFASDSNTLLPTQRAVKTYVDTLVTASLKYREPVRVATTANGTLASDFEDGDTIDGVEIATGDRLLIKNQSTATENGIYVVAASGAPSRSADADEDDELPGATVFVEEGSSQLGETWTNTNTSVTLGATDIAFAKISSLAFAPDDVTLELNGSTLQVKDDGIGSGQIASGAVGADQIATGSIPETDLQTAVQNKLRAVGEVITTSAIACPAHSLEANGAAISRSTYSAYFSAVGTRYGTGNGSTTFNLPDYRGYFLRGWDHGAGNDPNAGSRTNAGGGATGDNVGTKQASANLAHLHVQQGTFTSGFITASHGHTGVTDAQGAHSHGLTNVFVNATGGGLASGSNRTQGGNGATDSAGIHSHNVATGAQNVNHQHNVTISGNTQSSGGSESRPLNVYVLYCIFVGV